MLAYPLSLTPIKSGGSARRIEMPIKSFLYDGQTGLSTVGIQSHRLNIGDIVRVRDIKFDCDSYGNDKSISDVKLQQPQLVYYS